MFGCLQMSYAILCVTIGDMWCRRFLILIRVVDDFQEKTCAVEDYLKLLRIRV